MSIEKLKEALIDGFPDEYGKIVYETAWESEGKYEYCTVVIHAEGDGEIEEGYYKIHLVRSGSYYTYYEYLPPAVSKVVPFEETITVRRWREVN